MFMMIRAILFIGIILAFVGLIPATTAMVVNKDKVEISKLFANSRFASSIRVEEAMNHLIELQNIATATSGNRAVRTLGFNGTLDYITEQLALNTNFKVTTTFFNLRNFQLLRTPTLLSIINGVIRSHTHSLSGEFYYMQYTTSANFISDVLLTVIPNLGCSDEDWLAARPPPAGLVALVKRGDCTFVSKAQLAAKYNVAALLIYNDGAPGNTLPILANIGQNNRLPALFLSYALGQSLVDAANDPTRIASVRLIIETDNSLNPVGNICADTLTGDPTQTLVIGSHSDSVPAGPGINDNGSGTAANLVLAATLSRLLQTPDYPPLKYRVRFCWWGAEELGLIGAAFHVSEAQISTVVGERLSDYLANINLDMLGSPNFIFGIYNGRTAPGSTPASARPGSIKVTDLFQGWFDNNSLPWDYTNFDGRSDYGPFLAQGIVCGGLFSGADGVKTTAQRNRYAQMLGSSLAGTANVRLDVCYHQACDRTTNINEFSLDKMVQASAYAIEYLVQQPDLTNWLYPTGDIRQINKQSQEKRQFEYDSVNEYFGLPYN